MSQMQNVKMGTCSVTYGGDDLGVTKGDVYLHWKPDLYSVEVENYGRASLDKKVMGEIYSVTVPLAESTLENFKVAIPTLSKYANKATFGRKAGFSLLSLAKPLTLHPIDNEPEDLSDDITIYKATSVSLTPIPYSNTKLRVLLIEFEGLVDPTRTDGDLVGTIGDPTT